MTKLHKNKFIVYFCIFFVVFLWSMNFIAIKFVVMEIEAYSALLLRLFCVAIILLPFAKKPSLKELLMLILISLVLVAGHYGFLFLSMKHTTNTGAIALIMQLSIPFGVLLSRFIFKDKISILRFIGLVIAFGGIIAMFYDPSMLNNIKALFLGILSAFCFSVYFVLVKFVKRLSFVDIIAYTSVLGLPMLYGLAILNGENLSSIFDIKSNMTLIGFAYTIIGGSILGHGLWAWLVKHQDISFISPFLLLCPIGSTILSFVILKEAITISFVLTSMIVIFGILLVFVSKKID